LQQDLHDYLVMAVDENRSESDVAAPSSTGDAEAAFQPQDWDHLLAILERNPHLWTVSYKAVTDFRSEQRRNASDDKANNREEDRVGEEQNEVEMILHLPSIADRDEAEAEMDSPPGVAETTISHAQETAPPDTGNAVLPLTVEIEGEDFPSEQLPPPPSPSTAVFPRLGTHRHSQEPAAAAVCFAQPIDYFCFVKIATILLTRGSGPR
jgi:hypothetical protein